MSTWPYAAVATTTTDITLERSDIDLVVANGARRATLPGTPLLADDSYNGEQVAVVLGHDAID